MQPDDWTRLTNFVAGEGSPADRAEVQAWAHADADRANALASLQSAWTLGADEAEPFDKAKAWESILRRKAARSSSLSAAETHVKAPMHLRTSTRLTTIDNSLDSRRRARRAMWGIAATLLVMVGGVASWRLTQQPAPKVSHAVMPTRDFTTSRGQRAELRLTDGTKVILAAQSRLSVPSDYDSTKRRVTLVGEAYFDVVHDASRPFTVQAGITEVHDVGTRFDVRAYAERSGVRVLVTEGEIALRTSGAAASSHSVTRGQIARVRSDGSVHVASNADTAAFLSWTLGELVFNRTPAAEAMSDVSRWYDVDIKLDPTLRQRTLTTVLHDQSLSEVLHLVALSLDAKVSRSGSTVNLTAK